MVATALTKLQLNAIGVIGLGHFQYECPSWNKKANYVKDIDEEEEMLLMSYVEENKAKGRDAWFIDSGCSNHMCGDRTMFS